MKPEHRVLVLEKRVESLARTNMRLKSEQVDIFRYARKFPEGVGYVDYLREEVRSLERLVDKGNDDFAKLLDYSQYQDDIIERIKDHYPQVVTLIKPYKGVRLK